MRTLLTTSGLYLVACLGIDTPAACQSEATPWASIFVFHSQHILYLHMRQPLWLNSLNDKLTNWALVTPYAVIDLGQHWFR